MSHKANSISHNHIHFQALSRLSRLCVPVLMSRNHPWTLEPWHIRASMRKIGLEVNEVESIRYTTLMMKQEKQMCLL